MSTKSKILKKEFETRTLRSRLKQPKLQRPKRKAEEFKCSGCKKLFPSLSSVNRHSKWCKPKKTEKSLKVTKKLTPVKAQIINLQVTESDLDNNGSEELLPVPSINKSQTEIINEVNLPKAFKSDKQIKIDSFMVEEIFNDKPVYCPHCKNTYRTGISYNKHLGTCYYESSSSSCDEDEVNQKLDINHAQDQSIKGNFAQFSDPNIHQSYPSTSQQYNNSVSENTQLAQNLTHELKNEQEAIVISDSDSSDSTSSDEEIEDEDINKVESNLNIVADNKEEVNEPFQIDNSINNVSNSEFLSNFKNSPDNSPQIEPISINISNNLQSHLSEGLIENNYENNPKFQMISLQDSSTGQIFTLQIPVQNNFQPNLSYAPPFQNYLNNSEHGVMHAQAPVQTPTNFYQNSNINMSQQEYFTHNLLQAQGLSQNLAPHSTPTHIQQNLAEEEPKITTDSNMHLNHSQNFLHARDQNMLQMHNLQQGSNNFPQNLQAQNVVQSQTLHHSHSLNSQNSENVQEEAFESQSQSYSQIITPEQLKQYEEQVQATLRLQQYNFNPPPPQKEELSPPMTSQPFMIYQPMRMPLSNSSSCTGRSSKPCPCANCLTGTPTFKKMNLVGKAPRKPRVPKTKIRPQFPPNLVLLRPKVPPPLEPQSSAILSPFVNGMENSLNSPPNANKPQTPSPNVAVVRPMENPLQKLSKHVDRIESIFINRTKSTEKIEEMSEQVVQRAQNMHLAPETLSNLNMSQNIESQDHVAEVITQNQASASIAQNIAPKATCEDPKNVLLKSGTSNSGDGERRVESSTSSKSIKIQLKRQEGGDSYSINKVSGSPAASSQYGGLFKTLSIKGKITTGNQAGTSTDVVVSPVVHTVPIPDPDAVSDYEMNPTICEEEGNNSLETSVLLPVGHGPNRNTLRLTHRAVIVYEVKIDNKVQYKSSDVRAVWAYVLERVQATRVNHNLPPLPYPPTNISLPDNKKEAESSFNKLGLTHRAVQFLLEQIPGITKAAQEATVLKFQQPVGGGSREEDEESPIETQSGSARSEGYGGRKPFDMFGWLSSKYRIPIISTNNNNSLKNSGERSSGSKSRNLPIGMKYRNYVRTGSKHLRVFWSSIHGRGLFSSRDIESGELVVEYAGEVIRSGLCDLREKYYESKGIGCYMFRVDTRTVVDATLKGNAARFINHSCDPNCRSRVMEVCGKKHILIFSLRNIPAGEELTYDYKFDKEESDRLPCSCGTHKCRKFLN